jgi:hypothetical protein
LEFKWGCYKKVQHKMKLIILIVLKLDSDVSLGQSSGHGPVGSTQVNVKIKVVIIILKPNSKRGKIWVTSCKSQHKMIIIAILKSDSGVDPRQGLSYMSEEPTRLTQYFWK